MQVFNIFLPSSYLGFGQKERILPSWISFILFRVSTTLESLQTKELVNHLSNWSNQALLTFKLRLDLLLAWPHPLGDLSSNTCLCMLVKCRFVCYVGSKTFKLGEILGLCCIDSKTKTARQLLCDTWIILCDWHIPCNTSSQSLETQNRIWNYESLSDSLIERGVWVFWQKSKDPFP